MDEQSRIPTTASGRLQLTNWAIGVVNDVSLANQCAQALEADGFAAREICIVPGATALQQLRSAQRQAQRERAATRAVAAVEDAFKDVEPARSALVAEAQAAHTLIGAHVPQREQIDRIRNTFEEHQVHHLYLFRPTSAARLI
jgi:hypothetical protein